MESMMDNVEACVVCGKTEFTREYDGSIDVFKVNCNHCGEFKVTANNAMPVMINQMGVPNREVRDAISCKFKQNSEAGVENLIMEFSDYETLLESLSNL